jgi:hypothetical protein
MNLFNFSYETETNDGDIIMKDHFIDYDFDNSDQYSESLSIEMIDKMLGRSAKSKFLTSSFPKKMH